MGSVSGVKTKFRVKTQILNQAKFGLRKKLSQRNAINIIFVNVSEALSDCHVANADIFILN